MPSVERTITLTRRARAIPCIIQQAAGGLPNDYDVTTIGENGSKYEPQDSWTANEMQLAPVRSGNIDFEAHVQTKSTYESRKSKIN